MREVKKEQEREERERLQQVSDQFTIMDISVNKKKRNEKGKAPEVSHNVHRLSGIQATSPPQPPVDSSSSVHSNNSHSVEFGSSSHVGSSSLVLTNTPSLSYPNSPNIVGHQAYSNSNIPPTKAQYPNQVARVKNSAQLNMSMPHINAQSSNESRTQSIYSGGSISYPVLPSTNEQDNSTSLPNQQQGQMQQKLHQSLQQQLQPPKVAATDAMHHSPMLNQSGLQVPHTYRIRANSNPMSPMVNTLSTNMPLPQQVTDIVTPAHSHYSGPPNNIGSSKVNNMPPSTSAAIMIAGPKVSTKPPLPPLHAYACITQAKFSCRPEFFSSTITATIKLFQSDRLPKCNPAYEFPTNFPSQLASCSKRYGGDNANPLTKTCTTILCQ